MKVKLISATADPKQAIALAGSVCYDSVPKEQIVDHCYESGHHSILEFADFHFEVSGVSRALSHQLVRHRIASYAQRSQRYVTESNADFTVPQSLNRDSHNRLRSKYVDLMEAILGFYQEMLDSGIPAEDARYILPNSIHTTLHIKMNLRALINFMGLRLCNRAQWEIRKLAQLMREEIEKECPSIAAYLRPKCEAHTPHYCPEVKSCGRYPRLEDLIERSR